MSRIKFNLFLIVFLLASLFHVHAQDEVVNGNLTIEGTVWQRNGGFFYLGKLLDADHAGFMMGFGDYSNNNGIVTFEAWRRNVTWRWDALDYVNPSASRWQMMLCGDNTLVLYPTPLSSYPNGFNDEQQISLRPDRSYPQIYLGGMTIQHHEPGNGGGDVRFNTRCYAASWIWGSDSYSGSMTLTQMELNYSNQLILYDREEQANNHASIIISPKSMWGVPTPFIEVDGKKVVLETQSNPVRFNASVRIAPQGDLSMGSFTAEPQ